MYILVKVKGMNISMKEKDFKISCYNYTIIIQKGSQEFLIKQSNDNDIWFFTSQDEMNIELSLSSKNNFEWQTYIVFEYLMKIIIGRYVLNGDNEKEYSHLPGDFIDLETKVIIWHSDSDIDNLLKLEYADNGIIKIAIQKQEDSKKHYTNSVRIRTSGSEYGCYYQEFLEFFKHLMSLEQSLNKTVENKQQDRTEKQKKLSLFKRFNNE